jgi:biotin-(acetyl-CoA carboxylase) ligase
MLGSRVKVICQNKKIEGLVQDIDLGGALIVRLDNGFQEKILSGDVVLVR